MNHCLWCQSEIIHDISWENLFSLAKPPKLCKACQKNLIQLSGNRCQKCSRESTNPVCSDCAYWEEHLKEADPLENNYSVYMYNDWLKEVMAKWKYRGDYQLVEIFQKDFTRHYHQFVKKQRKDAIIIPIPLSIKRLSQRKFNQAHALASYITKTPEDCLERMETEKQAKKSRYERLTSKNPFHLRKSLNKPVILVDDIYTTGTTLRHAAHILKNHGCPAVYGYTLIRG